MANKCVNLAKFALVLNVLIFFVGGAVLILLGSLILDNAGGIGNIARSTYISLPSAIMLISGLCMLGLGFIGCFACMKQTQCLNNTFFILMFVIILVEVIALGLSITYRNELESSVDSYLKRGLNEYQDAPGLRKEIDFIQKQYECCGVDNYTDWYNTTFFIKQKVFPNSCCSNDNCTYAKEEDEPVNLFEQGCYSRVETFFNRYMVYLIVGYTIFIIVQSTALLASCVIAHRARQAEANPYSAFGVNA